MRTEVKGTANTPRADNMPAESAEMLQFGDVILVLQVIWRRKWLVLLGGLVGFAAGYAYLSQQEDVYQSSAQVLVIKKRPHEFTGMYSQQASTDDDVSVHVALLKSPNFVRRAVQKHKFTELRSFQGLRDPTNRVVSSLYVSRDNKGPVGSPTSVMSLSFRGQYPKDCQVVLTKIIDSYQEFLDETSNQANRSAEQMLVQKRDAAKIDLKQKIAAYEKFREEAPLLFSGKDGTDLSQDRLAEIEKRRSTLRIRQAEIEPQLKAIRKGMKEGKDRRSLLSMITESNTKVGTSPMEAKLFPLLLEETTLLEDFGPDHPDVLAVRKQIEFTREFYAAAAADSEAEAAARITDPIQLFVTAMDRELRDIESTQKALDDLLKEEDENAKELRNHEFQDRQLRAEITRAEEFLADLEKQMQGVALGKELVGYSTNVIKPASLGAKVSPRPFLISTIAVFLGCLGGLGLAWMFEAVDKSFRSSEEVQRRLGLPLVGHIPLLPSGDRMRKMDKEGDLVSGLVCTLHEPNSVESEAFRGVRTALYFNTHVSGHKVVQVTSPNVSDGKSTLTANMAVAIAQSGKHVLLIDADLRRPKQNELFGISNENGLADVIAGDREFADCIQSGIVDKLDVLPSGPPPPNPADLLISPRFEELVEMVREKYDFVLIDTPALLAVTDPCVVASCVDGVLLTIRVTKNGRPQVEHATELLSTLNTDILGVVVNAKDRNSRFGRATEHSHMGFTFGYDANRSYYAKRHAGTASSKS
jgi:capsular exopolysaccharide synthesis family protein